MRLRLMLSALVCLALTAGFQPSFASGAVLVGEDPIDNPVDPEAQGAWNGAGLDIRELYIGQVASGDVEFTIQVENLDAPPPNEVMRYNWSFLVNGVEYGINAKTSDVVSVVTPTSAVETLEHAASGESFRLRTGCLVTQITTCAHIMWLDGEFDPATNQVRIRIPLDDPRTPDITAGASIDPGPGFVQASVQAGVSNASTSDTAIQDLSYVIS